MAVRTAGERPGRVDGLRVLLAYEPTLRAYGDALERLVRDSARACNARRDTEPTYQPSS